MITGKKLNLVMPTREDHENVQCIWEDPDTMRDIGGVVPISHEQYLAWWADLFEERQYENEYYLVLDTENSECFGEASFEYPDITVKRARLNLKIRARHRGKGIGTEALGLLLEQYFEVFGGLVMEDCIAPANQRTAEWLKDRGFSETRRDADGIHLELGLEDYRRRRAATAAGMAGA